MHNTADLCVFVWLSHTMSVYMVYLVLSRSSSPTPTGCAFVCSLCCMCAVRGVQKSRFHVTGYMWDKIKGSSKDHKFLCLNNGSSVFISAFCSKQHKPKTKESNSQGHEGAPQSECRGLKIISTSLLLPWSPKSREKRHKH